MSLLMEQALNGVQLGVTLFLLAAGLTLIFGIMGVINLAHGSLYMIGAYAMAAVAAKTGSFLLAFPAGLAAAGLAGVLMEYLVVRRLYARDHLDQVLATFGLILFSNQLTTILFGRQPLFVQIPDFLDGSVMIGGTADPSAQIRIPLAMMNRHGLVAGATGTGKTKTLQVIAEQLSAAGVPVVMADFKGDLSGLSRPAESNDKIAERATDTGDQWVGTPFPVEFFSLGTGGIGVPVRATISAFGPILLSKVLGLNQNQESTLGLIFHDAA